ncbi:methyltransferase [Paraburkholderia silvatlantica]|uniref:Cyclopropane fatty-acyl-phospholipid synthase-like methyltransferase n=1 Tax=Paraburkholderia silvatlantica TaxID=321895 RepID=A0ABR6FMN3_9BURK|nr:methyltransferase [Paraburkholderia silvatlantica]MBB2928050.1 cyclopropane fatty-acyl-phospholipid synthase-like methyltransferase [Paraburkholderia silvatlantica]PVY31016.1 methyltransferase family protein [Paraburkholderia silvatlantica]PXW37152.1 methyltransferase family protein [Paraburkholderia silvatlantica]
MIPYLAVFLTLLVGASLLISAALTGVPTLSSGRSEVDDIVALLEHAKLPKHALIVDLGSGWGALVIALARAFPEASVQGVEISLFPYLVSRLRTHHLPNVSLNWGNFFHGDPGNADAIVCYLMPGVMAKLGNFLDKAARPGTFVVTNTFLFRERRASAVRRRGLRGSVALYIWPGRHWAVKDGDDIARV